ncbi:hypothetical protein DFH09DRAFT_1364370 [Mycena vulgaris]|nr:hypothetical protein DFH09DRAFT_1364370 [Mycena vulgaris]
MGRRHATTACPRRAGTTRLTCCTRRASGYASMTSPYPTCAPSVFGVEREREEGRYGAASGSPHIPSPPTRAPSQRVAYWKRYVVRFEAPLEELEASVDVSNITSFRDNTSLGSGDLTAISDLCGDEMDYSEYWSSDPGQEERREPMDGCTVLALSAFEVPFIEVDFPLIT